MLFPSINWTWTSFSVCQLFLRQTFARFQTVVASIISFPHLLMKQDPVGGDDGAPHPVVNVLPEHVLSDPEWCHLILHSLLSIWQVAGTKSWNEGKLYFGAELVVRKDGTCPSCHCNKPALYLIYLSTINPTQYKTTADQYNRSSSVAVLIIL